jgi:hypothetical protein
MPSSRCLTLYTVDAGILRKSSELADTSPVDVRRAPIDELGTLCGLRAANGFRINFRTPDIEFNRLIQSSRFRRGRHPGNCGNLPACGTQESGNVYSPPPTISATRLFSRSQEF